MNQLFAILFFLPVAALNGAALQAERRGLSWGWILLILLILAFVILWWLLGPGARGRRRKMTDLSKPARAITPKQAGLPLSVQAKPASPPPAPVSALAESVVIPPVPAMADEAAIEAITDDSTA